MKTALITGTNMGIGKALAEKFIAEGWFVIGTCVSGLNLEDSQSFKGYDLDLSSPKSIDGFVRTLVSEKRRIDLLINNAGVVMDEFDESVIMAKFRQTLEVNLFGPIDLTERLIPLLNKGAQVLNMSSTAGVLSKELRVFKYPSYKISKTALNMYTRTLAGRLAAQGIFVASIHPGWVKTDMGGSDADMSPEQSALDIYMFVIKEKPLSDTGFFWFKGEKLAW